MNERVTIYNYNLNDDVNEADFVTCSDKVGQLMKNHTGFMYRSLGKTEDNIWVDVNYSLIII